MWIEVHLYPGDLNRFQETHDYAEAIRCLHDMKAPFFHHEFVKQLAMFAATCTQVDFPPSTGYLK